jgi:hypothetical protein
MPIVRFTGQVLPDVMQVTIKDHPSIDWYDADAGIQCSFRISIQQGKIEIDCICDKYEDADLSRVYMRAFDLARATVDLTCFSTGFGLTVILDRYTNPSGSTTPIAPHTPALSALCTAFNLEPSTSIEQNEFHKVLTMVLTDWRLFRILRQLIEANTVPHESAVNCARVVEGVRHLLALSGSNTKQSWVNMRERLNLSVDYLKLITDVSTGPRHGDTAHITGATTIEITTRTWAVMNRLLEYKKRNDQPLPVAEFPVL